MKFINKFFIGLMALSLATTVLAFCLDQTVFNAKFDTATLDKSGVYTDLSTQLPKTLAGGGDTSPAIQSALTRVMTPAYLQVHFDNYLTDLMSAYKNGTTVPQLDLTSVIPQAEALGVPLTAQDKADLTKNLTVDFTNLKQKDNKSSQDGQGGQNGSGSNSGPTTATPAPATTTTTQGPSQIYHKAAASKWLLVLGTLILAAIVFLTASHHRLKALGHGFIGAAIWLAIYGAFFKIAPSIAIHQLKTAKDVSLASSVTNLVTLLAGGVAQRLLFAAIGSAAIGALLWIISMFMPHFGGGKDPKAKGDNRTPLPGVFHKS